MSFIETDDLDEANFCLHNLQLNNKNRDIKVFPQTFETPVSRAKTAHAVSALNPAGKMPNMSGSSIIAQDI